MRADKSGARAEALAIPAQPLPVIQEPLWAEPTGSYRGFRGVLRGFHTGLRGTLRGFEPSQLGRPTAGTVDVPIPAEAATFETPRRPVCVQLYPHARRVHRGSWHREQRSRSLPHHQEERGNFGTPPANRSSQLPVSIPPRDR